jgi:hypothetical protein
MPEDENEDEDKVTTHVQVDANMAGFMYRGIPSSVSGYNSRTWFDFPGKQSHEDSGSGVVLTLAPVNQDLWPQRGLSDIGINSAWYSWYLASVTRVSTCMPEDRIDLHCEKHIDRE